MIKNKNAATSGKVAGKNMRLKKEKKQEKRVRSERDSVPLAMSRRERVRAPKIEGSPYSGDGRIRVRHREFIRDVHGSEEFVSTLYQINPGLPTMFPWLSVVAAQYESYLFRSLKFCYETQKSASTSGSVMLAVDFDAADDAPTNKQVMMSYHNAVRASVWNECIFRGDARDLKKFGVQRYIRSGNIAANLDIKTYDVGNLIVATQGEENTSAIGELYVEYEIELITPQTQVNAALALSYGGNFSPASLTNCFTNLTSSSGGLAITPSNDELKFGRVGSYLVELVCNGSNFTNTPPTVTGTALYSDALSWTGANAFSASASYKVQVTDYGQTFKLNFTGSATSLSTITARVSSYSGL